MIEIDPEKMRALVADPGDPWVPENAYFAFAEPHMPGLWRDLVFPFIAGSDFADTLDLAAGAGRNSVFLLRLAQRLTIMDYQPGNVEVCRRRFAGHGNVTFHANNGYDMRPVPDASLTLVYCFDAMVHFDSDVVRAYLRDTARVLKPGGRGFFHHSNYTAGLDWKENSRNFMSKALFAHYARKEGLAVLAQKVIQWGDVPEIDCLSLVARPA